MIISRDNMPPRTMLAVVYASNPQTHMGGRGVVSILQGTQVGKPVSFLGKDFSKVMLPPDGASVVMRALHHCNLCSTFWIRV